MGGEEVGLEVRSLLEFQKLEGGQGIKWARSLGQWVILVTQGALDNSVSLVVFDTSKGSQV